MSVKKAELAALNGERISMENAHGEGAESWRMEMRDEVPSGTYYFHAQGTEGEGISVKVMIVR